MLYSMHCHSRAGGTPVAVALLILGAMNLPPPIETLPYNWWTNRAGSPIVGIVAHNTVGVDSRVYLSRGGDLADGRDRKVSIHVLIAKDGTQYRYVPDERGANHAGSGKLPPPWGGINPNRCTLGFELENASNGIRRVDPYPDDQLLSMGYLLVVWRTHYGPLPLFRHGDIDPMRRKDPVGLSVATMEEWFIRARDGETGPVIHRYRVKALAARVRNKPTTRTAQIGTLGRGKIVRGLVVQGLTLDDDGKPNSDWLKLDEGQYIWTGLLEKA